MITSGVKESSVAVIDKKIYTTGGVISQNGMMGGGPFGVVFGVDFGVDFGSRTNEVYVCSLDNTQH